MGATLAKHGSFSTGTGVATTQVAITGVGFQPKLVLMFWNGQPDTTDALTTTASHRRGFGVAKSSTERWCVMSTSVDNTGDTNAAAFCGRRTDACAAIISDAGAIASLLDFVSMDSDGFTVVIDTAFAATLRIHYLALGGDDFVSAVGNFAGRTSTGDSVISGLSFAPQAFIFAQGSLSSVAETLSDSDSTMMIGVAAGTAATTQGSLATGSDHLQATTDTARYCRSAEALSFINPTITATVTSRASISAWAADGGTLTWAEAEASDRKVLYCAIGGCRAKVTTFINRNTDTADVAVTGVGFSPRGGLFLTHGTAESSSDTPATTDVWSVGAASGVGGVAVGVSDQHNAATPAITCDIQHDAVTIRTATGNNDGISSMKSLDSDGYTIQTDVQWGAAAMTLGLVFGDPVTGTLACAMGAASFSGTGTVVDVTGTMACSMGAASFSGTGTFAAAGSGGGFGGLPLLLMPSHSHRRRS